jgi:ZIP family zinc transporter
MYDAFAAWPPVWQALAATLFTWGVTALGAGAVFFFKDVSRKALDTALGFTAGVMIAASFWSLLNPAIAMAEEMGMVKWVPALVGFLAGAFAMRLVDFILPHVHLFGDLSSAEGVKTSWRRTTLLVLAITLHNIPEGLAIGVAFGAVAAGYESATLGAAIALAIGIGIQNCPEGTAIAVPLRREGLSRAKVIGGRRARRGRDWRRRRSPHAPAPALRARVRGRRHDLCRCGRSHSRVADGRKQ